jgi:hypothetical protein
MTKNKEDDERPLADDLLFGARAIGEFIGLDERQTFHQAANGNIPVTKMGRLIVASRRMLRRHFTKEA